MKFLKKMLEHKNNEQVTSITINYGDVSIIYYESLLCIQIYYPIVQECREMY